MASPNYKGNRIKEMIKARGVSISEVSRQCNISLPTMYLYCSYDREPSAANLLNIAEFLDIDPALLIIRKKL